MHSFKQITFPGNMDFFFKSHVKIITGSLFIENCNHAMACVNIKFQSLVRKETHYCVGQLKKNNKTGIILDFFVSSTFQPKFRPMSKK